MRSNDELAYKTATELSAGIRRRDLSPVEVVEGYIRRIEERNPSLNAFVYEGFEDARRRAREAEDTLMSGDEVGPLHGVPTAMKDLFDFKPGWPTTFGGVRAFENFVADFYCAWAERMEAAGAIIMGKTNSPVMGFRGTCDNYMFGPTRNPFDPSRNSGGSSGGSAAAVADGLLPIAEGTDGGGSVRIPASWCGVYGFKQSYGRVPYTGRPNAFGSIFPFIFEGTISRTVEDAALGLNALSGYDPRDPFSLDDGPHDFTQAIRRSIKGWRVAYSPNLDIFPVDRRVAEVVDAAVKTFEEAGASVEEVDLGITRDVNELSDLWCRQIIVINVEAFENFKRQGLDLLADHRDDFPPQYLEWIEKGYEMGVADLARDLQARTEIYDATQKILEDHDLLVCPTLACLPVENADDGNTVGPSEINGVEVDPLIGWCLTYFANFTGHPAASVPAGLADDRLPVGMQILGRRYADEDVLAASAVFERMRPWQHTYELCKNRSI